MSNPDADRLLLGVTRGAAVLSGAVILLIGGFVALEAIPFLLEGGLHALWADSIWRPESGLYGVAPLLAGTLLVSAGALGVAVPVGVLSAVFVRFYAPGFLRSPFRRVLELLAGIPSVVYGFWGLVVLAPLIGELRPPGPSLLAGICILALMILPIIALTSHGALREVPREQLEGAAALGLSRWGTVRGVALPAARAGILTGIVLALGRAVGETMAVLMVTGNVVQVPDSVFEPVRAMTANIALEMAYALDHHRAALFVTGLLLLLMVTALVAAAEALGRERGRA